MRGTEPSLLPGKSSEAIGPSLQSSPSPSFQALSQEEPSEQADPGTGLLQKDQQSRAFWGLVWTGIGLGSTHVLRFGFNLLLTRLLVPEIFGLMALVNTLLQGLALFSEVGIGTSIIQNKSGDEERFLNTAWTLQVMRGLLLWLGSIALAWPASVFYQIPLLLWLVPAIGANSAIAGFNSTSLHTLARHLIRGPLVILNLGSYIINMLVTIAWVKWVGADVWGFVVGNLVGGSIMLVASHLFQTWYACRTWNRLCWDWASIHKLIHFGMWIFVGTMFGFLSDQADRLIVGKVADLTMLGLYQVANSLVYMPVMIVQTIMGLIIMPIYSRQFHQGHGIMSRRLHAHGLIASCAGLVSCLLVVTGPLAITCLYDARYVGAEWMIRILGAAAFFKLLESASNTALLAMGQSKAPALAQGGKVLAMLVLMPAGYYFYGFPGMVIGYACTEISRYAIVGLALYRQGEHVLRCDFLILLCTLVIGTAASAVFLHLEGTLNKWIHLALLGSLICLLWLGVILGARTWPRIWTGAGKLAGQGIQPVVG